MTDDTYTHRNGVWWHQAPLPRRWHTCTWWSFAWYPKRLECVQRCACGAIRLDAGPWIEKNSRRKEGKR